MQDQIWAELPERRAKLGIALHQTAWTPTEIRSFVSESLQFRRGTWVVGVYGAVAEFSIGSEEPFDFDQGERHVAATTARGAIRFEITDRVRVLALMATVGLARRELVVLAVPCPPAEPRKSTGLLSLGPDLASIRESDRGELLFDLGIGIGETRFCVRTSDSRLANGLGFRTGRKWPELLADFGRPILEASPTRVAWSPVGRVEVFAPIPAPGGQSPDGPHTHLLPAHLALGRETPPGLQLPQAYAPWPIFHPETAPTIPCAG